MEQLRLSKLACKRIAFYGEMNRTAMCLILIFGTIGIGLLLIQHLGLVLLCGFGIAMAYMWLPRLFKVKLIDLIATSKDEIKEKMVEHQAMRVEQKTREGYEVKAEEAMKVIDD